MSILRPTTIFVLSLLLGVISCFDPNIDDHTEDNIETDPHLVKYNLWQEGRNIMPRYDGSDSGPIDELTARAWINNFSNSTRTKIKTHYFDRSSLLKVISQEGCKGIRIHYAINDKGDKTLVISGVDNEGINLTEALLTSSSETDNELINVDTFIDLAIARRWVENFKKVKDGEEIISHYFGQNPIKEILDAKECTGIRIYYAMTDTYENKLIIAGTQSNDEDIMSSSPTSTLRTKSIEPLIDYSFPCPSVCGPDL